LRQFATIFEAGSFANLRAKLAETMRCRVPNDSERGGPSNHQLITFEDHPFNFVGLFGLHLLFILTGCLGFVFIAREMQAWLNREKSGR